MTFRQEDHAYESGFLRQIIADPTDDAARLVYADWLEERGEPQAEFIRIQIALANDKHRHGEEAGLKARAAALYWKHHRHWNGQVYRQWIGTLLEGKRAHAGGLRGWHYRRGFPEILDVSAEFFAQHADLFLSAAPFQEVILRHPPQNLQAYLARYEPALQRLHKVVLPLASDQLPWPSVPWRLRDHIVFGIRAQCAKF